MHIEIFIIIRPTRGFKSNLRIKLEIFFFKRVKKGFIVQFNELRLAEI